MIQATIGRPQSFAVTKAAADGLRARGIRSLNVDILYGLPHQTERGSAKACSRCCRCRPTGWRFTATRMCHGWRGASDDPDRCPALARRAARTLRDRAQLFVWDGYREIGIDHFAREGDGLEVADREGRLRRNFQGYTDDTAAALIGVGASSISRFPQGFAQNNASTSAYQGSDPRRALRHRARPRLQRRGPVARGDDRGADVRLPHRLRQDRRGVRPGPARGGRGSTGSTRTRRGAGSRRAARGRPVSTASPAIGVSHCRRAPQEGAFGRQPLAGGAVVDRVQQAAARVSSARRSIPMAPCATAGSISSGSMAAGDMGHAQPVQPRHGQEGAGATPSSLRSRVCTLPRNSTSCRSGRRCAAAPAPQARRAHHRPLRQIGQPGARRDEGIAHILAREVAVQQQPLGLQRRHVLHRMHRDVDGPVQQRPRSRG
jgi:hypothetical protein